MDAPEKVTFVLRPLSLEDTDELFALTIKNKNNLRVFLNWMRDDYNIDDTIKFLTESLEKENNRKMFLRAIIRDDKIIGIVDLHAINQDKNAEVGYWIDEEEQGKGIATEATKIIITEGFVKLNLQRIGLRCAEENAKSCAIPKKLGFTKEGILRDAVFLEGKFHNMELWSLLKEEWKTD